MAKMYPNKFPKDNDSTGERKVYEYFKQQAPDDWIVLHSLRLPKHHEVVFGESDFVVLAPGYGVFVLEIKSGGVGFDGSYWIFRDRNGKATKKQRGPFKQAEEGMFQVSEMIINRLGEKFDRRHLLYGYGVIFTDEADFPRETIVEDEPWRLYQKSNGTNYGEFVVQLANNFINELKALRKNLPRRPSVADVEKIRRVLRPEVDCIPPLKSFLEDSEEEILSLTNEQYDCLDDLDENKRVIVLGGAGTGKTLIAVQAAKRAAEGNGRVGLICFNRNLAEYLKFNVPEARVEVYTLHGLMCKLSGVTEIRNDENFFETELPEKAIAALDNAIFDKLIIDEFQDICIPGYLAFLDGVLKGGVERRIVRVFRRFFRTGDIQSASFT